MAVTLRGTPTLVAPGNVTSLTLAQPGSITTGDVGVITVVTSSATVSAPGWTLTETYMYSSTMYLHVLTRAMQTGDVGNIVVTLSSQNRATGGIAVFAGSDAALTADDITMVTGVDPPSVARPGTRVGYTVIAERASSGLSTSFTAPAGWSAAIMKAITGTGGTAMAVSSLLTDGGTIDPAAWGRNGTLVSVVTATISISSPVPPPTQVTSTTSTTWQTRTLVDDMAWPHICAHRGGNPGPEETLPAYQASAAVGQSVSAEADMQILSDGSTVVLCHDDTIDRTASSLSPITTGAVAGLSSAQWATVLMRDDVASGHSDAAAGTLAMLAAEYGPGGAAGYRRLLILENKSGTDATVTIAAIKAAGLAVQTIYQGFTYADVVEAVGAGLHGMYLTNSPVPATLSAAGIEHVGVASASVTAQMVTDCHAAGIKVWAYTVNTTSSRSSLAALGVDAFFTDEPAILAGGGTTPVTSTTATTYAVRAQVTSTSATTWTTRARVTSTTATTWAARTTATSTTSTTWAVRARVASTTATTYPVRARITSSTATGWAARAIVTSTTATGWAARVSVTSTTATTWNVLADSPPGTVTSTTSTTWPVRAQTTSTSATTWATRAAITSTTTTAYQIRSRTTSTTSTTWAARARVAATGGTTWPARGSVSAAGSTTWAARSRLVSLTLTEWAALAHVTSTASATWAIASEAARDVMVLSILWRPRRVRVVAARAGTDITEHRRATVERGARP